MNYEEASEQSLKPTRGVPSTPRKPLGTLPDRPGTVARRATRQTQQSLRSLVETHRESYEDMKQRYETRRSSTQQRLKDAERTSTLYERMQAFRGIALLATAPTLPAMYAAAQTDNPELGVAAMVTGAITLAGRFFAGNLQPSRHEYKEVKQSLETTKDELRGFDAVLDIINQYDETLQGVQHSVENQDGPGNAASLTESFKTVSAYSPDRFEEQLRRKLLATQYNE